MTAIRDLGWWYWTLTAGLLAGGLTGWRPGLPLAMSLCTVQLVHVLLLTRHAAAFPVQVRAAYLALLAAGLWGPLQWVHWMQLIGTTARVVIGYCLLARVLSLAPWNRWQPLSRDLVHRTFLSLSAAGPPCGQVFRGMALERVPG